MDFSFFYRPIELVEISAEWKNVPIVECGEELIGLKDLTNNKLFVEPIYYNQNIPDSTSECYVRYRVADMLVEAAKKLPVGFALKIFDAWRPLRVQEYLFAELFNKIKCEQSKLSREKMINLAEKYVALPNTDINNPSPHFTGGAVDLTIVDKKGDNINMGGIFDDFSNKSHTMYYEEKIANNELLTSSEINNASNRRLLYNIMLSVGFTNYTTEWWHYDYGNQLWGYINKQKAIYGFIYNKP